MMTTRIRSLGLGIALLVVGAPLALAQSSPASAPVQANPAPGCKVSAKELEANRQVAMKFFAARGADRVALADASYIQHNPVFKKRAAEAHMSDYEEFKQTFLAQAAAPPTAPAANAGPQPPAGNNYEVVTAECDIVTMVRKIYRQDPTAAPGTFYESFSFDTFRVKNGKLVEHWDNAQITPPAK
jgi:predicted SnoaL-like aldol condensation-catalyzing enzyme